MPRAQVTKKQPLLNANDDSITGAKKQISAKVGLGEKSNLYLKILASLDFRQSAKIKGNLSSETDYGTYERYELYENFYSWPQQPTGYPYSSIQDQSGTLKTKNSARFSAGLGYNATNKLRIELMLNMLNGKTYKNSNKSMSGDFTILNPMVIANYDIAEFKNLTPFISAGLGIAKINLSNLQIFTPQDQYANPPLMSTFVTYSDIKKQFNFTWTIGTGVAYNIAEDIIAELSYYYTDYGTIKQTQTNPIPTYSKILKINTFDKIYRTVYDGGKISTRLVSHSINLGVRFKL